MTIVLILICLTACLAWAWLLSMRGGFWRADVRLEAAPDPTDWPEIAVLVPARDEAASVPVTLRAHATCGYRGRLQILLIDDGSRDGTAEAARAVAAESQRSGGHAVHVLTAPERPSGWSGKLWALETGHKALAELAPRAEWVLLADADIRFEEDTLAKLVAKARADRLGLASLMARLDDGGAWGGLLIPAFVFFFHKLYPFRWVNDRTHKTAAAAGGCILVRRRLLERIGWPGAMRGALIDDCALAARAKGDPGNEPIWLGLADDAAVSLRETTGLGDVWQMVTRTAFAQLDHNWLWLAGTVLGMAVLYLAGPLTVLSVPLHGSAVAALLGGIAWGLAGLAYAPTLGHFGRPIWEAAGLPVAAALYTAMTVDSARRHASGEGAAWKGRRYG
ncbi:MAG: glycosyltransferase [Pseudomonadota bacterium]